MTDATSLEERAAAWMEGWGRKPHHFVGGDGEEWNWVCAYASPLPGDPCFLPRGVYQCLPGHEPEAHEDYHIYPTQAEARAALLAACARHLAAGGWLPPPPAKGVLE